MLSRCSQQSVVSVSNTQACRVYNQRSGKFLKSHWNYIWIQRKTVWSLPTPSYMFVIVLEYISLVHLNFLLKISIRDLRGQLWVEKVPLTLSVVCGENIISSLSLSRRPIYGSRGLRQSSQCRCLIQRCWFIQNNGNLPCYYYSNCQSHL